jgi:hypothetical protein
MPDPALRALRSVLDFQFSQFSLLLCPGAKASLNGTPAVGVFRHNTHFRFPLLSTNQESFMTSFRFIPLALAATSALVACNTAPMMPMGSASASSMAMPDHMGKMDAQMKTMQGMHEKMMSAKTPEERSKLMAEHMKAMQDGMAMMEGMSGAGMGGMKGMPGMTGGMGTHHQMMEKRMEMMQTMMKMMMDRMPATPAK